MTPSRLAHGLDRAVAVPVLLCPLFLVHGRGLAEACIDATALLFLLRSAVGRDWRWLRTGWVPVAALWWGWLLLCSWPGIGESGTHSLVEAALVARLPLFAAALEWWALRPPARRRTVLLLVRLAALYIVAQEAMQLATGRNLFGYPRRGGGELTGPYAEARAAPVLSRLVFPALLPLAARWWGQGGAARWGAAAAVAGALVAVALFGQRMPLLLCVLGLVVSALLLPRLRLVVAVACLGGALAVAATAVVLPPTFYRLTTFFAGQVADWPHSPYGQLAARAVSIAAQNPITGRGFDAFRTACQLPEYWHGWAGVLANEHGFTFRPQPPATDPAAVRAWVDGYGGGVLICAQHPHNHYLQAAAESGLPGVGLFAATVLAWLWALGRGLVRRPDPLRVGLFVAVLIQEWPLASTSDFANMPLGGWFFLLLGFGLAEARWPAEPAGAQWPAAPPAPICAAEQEIPA